MNKTINFELFLELLSDRIDLQKVKISREEFLQLEFSVQKIPAFFIKIWSFLIDESFERALEIRTRDGRIDFFKHF